MHCRKHALRAVVGALAAFSLGASWPARADGSLRGRPDRRNVGLSREEQRDEDRELGRDEPRGEERESERRLEQKSERRLVEDPSAEAALGEGRRELAENGEAPAHAERIDWDETLRQLKLRNQSHERAERAGAPARVGSLHRAAQEAWREPGQVEPREPRRETGQESERASAGEHKRVARVASGVGEYASDDGAPEVAEQHFPHRPPDGSRRDEKAVEHPVQALPAFGSEERYVVCPDRPVVRFELEPDEALEDGSSPVAAAAAGAGRAPVQCIVHRGN